MKTDFFRTKKRTIIILSIVLVAAVGVLIGSGSIRGARKASGTAETTGKVTRGDVKVEISGSGVIEPVERYDITPLINGNIIESPFEEGQQVKKGDVLYKFDATELEGNIQKAKNTISRIQLSDKSTKDSLGQTVIYAGISGKLTNFTVKANQTVSGSELGEITDDSYRIARVPFNKAQIEKISVGQQATITSSAHMSSIEGTVSRISNISSSQADGALLYDVEIKIAGAGSLAKGTVVTAAVGNMESPGAGSIDVPEPYPVISRLSGRVVKIYASNNDFVAAGQRLLELDSTAYTDTLSKSRLDLNDAMLTLESQQKQLEDYNIKSPINGMVLKKNNKAGDTINAGLSAAPLMVVANMGKVKFDMKIDELDIAKIKIGQAVKVLADALPENTFTGRVTSIAGEGTAVNGVSNYIVQVTIDEPGELKSGMNVTAKTIVEEKGNTLLVPAAAVQKKDGKTYVNVPGENGGGQRSISIQIGINSKDYIEVISGLKEGDQVIMPAMADESLKDERTGMMGSRGQGGGPGGMDAIPR